MGIPSRLIEFLNEGQVRYQVVHHPAAFTAQELAAIENVKGRNHAKVVMVKAGSRLLMVVLPADYRVDLGKLSEATGGAAMLASETDFQALFPDCAVGTMPPFGRLYQVPTYVDRHLTADDMIVFEAGTHTDAIRLRYADYERLAQPQVADFAVKM